MALVMLPCELPWWSVVVRKITAIESTNDVEKILEVMQRIHDLCNISLDPDEDQMDNTVFDGLRQFISEMSELERDKFLNSTLKTICRYAKNLKLHRPPRGMNFSLQQNSDSVEFEVKFIACLLANSFFSTYPKRTNKTHPTLKDFNFTHFFKDLNTNSQRAKFRSFLWYFEWLDLQNQEDVLDRKIKLSRKVLSGKQWLTIEDWIECKLPLCPLNVKHEGRIESSRESIAQVIFTRSSIGSKVLLDGTSQESTILITHPELLILILFAENLEDNETLLAENIMQISRLIDPKNKAIIEKLEKPKMKSTMICMDAESYETFPPSQYEEDNCLRELNKCLLAFRQNTCASMSSKLLRILSSNSHSRGGDGGRSGRLSPIGESCTTTPGKGSLDCSTKIFIEPVSPTASHSTATFGSQIDDDEANRRRNWLNLPANKLRSQNSVENDKLSVEDRRRGRFIVLGSSGECLPVNREFPSPRNTTKAAQFFAGDSDDEDDEIFYSARNSMNSEDSHENEDSKHDDFFDHQRYSVELETPENRFRFAQHLKDALKLENGYSESTEDCSIEDEDFSDSYAVDINVEGSRIHDEKIKIRRGNSTGFILEDEESLDDCQAFLKPLYNRPKMKRNKTGNSSRYSFDTEESELEEIYDQLSKWLDDPLDSHDRKPDARDKAVMKYAESLLKRALSESFLGEEIDETSTTLNNIAEIENGSLSLSQKRKMISNFRSLSLEISKHKNLLATQMSQQNSLEDFKKFITEKVALLRRKSQKNQRRWSLTTTKLEENINCDVTIKLTQRYSQLNSNLRSIATGSWGCGIQQQGDPQFKVLVQWCAASVANVPSVIYYTCGRESLSKLDTVVRVLQDRKWTVGELLRHTLYYARNILNNPTNNTNFCLFDKLIGLEKGIN